MKEKNWKRAGFLLALVLSLSAALGAQEPSEEQKPETAPAAILEEAEYSYRCENSGVVTGRERARIHILREEGRQQFGQLFFPFRAQLSELRIRGVRSIKATGEVVEADVSAPLEITPPVTQEAPQFTDLKYKVIPVAGLQVGDRLEYEVETITKVPFKPGDFWLAHVPVRHLIVESERVTLDLPADREVSLWADPSIPFKVEEMDGRRRYRWTLSNAEPAAGGKRAAKRLFEVSSLRSWNEVGRWYRELQAPQSQRTPELEALAKRLVEGKKSPQEKVDALYRYVSQSIRYVSISLGLGGYQAHRSADIVRNEYGDCKDKQTLLATLLDTVGIDSYAALVSTDRALEPSVSSPGQFDHVINVVPLGTDTLWLDSTQEVAPLGYLPRGFLGKKVLLVRGDKSELVDIPREVPVADRRVVSVAGELDAGGTLRARVQSENRGYYEVYWRQLFRRGNREQIENALRYDRPMALWRSDVEKPTSSDPNNLAGAFTFEYGLTQKRFVSPLQRNVSLAAPVMVLDNLPWKLPDADDKDAVELDLGGPDELTDVLELQVDPAYKLTVPTGTRETRDWGSYESSYEFRDGKLVVRRRLQVRPAKLPLERRGEVEALAKAVEHDREQELVFERVTPVDARAVAEEMSADELAEAAREATGRNDFALARDLLQKATEKDPNHKYAWNNYGLVLFQSGEFDKAQAAYERQLEVNPRDEYANGNLGRLFLVRNRLDEARRAFEKHLEVKPLDAYAYWGLGFVHEQQKHWPEAEAAFDRAVSLVQPRSPAAAEFLVHLGEARLRQGKVEEARANFEAAVEASGAPNIYNNVAYVLAVNKQELDLALDYAESAVQRVEAELRLTRSVKGWQRTLAVQGALGSFLDTLGWVLFQQGRVEDSVPYLEASFELARHSEIAEHLARIRAIQGKPEEALRFYALSLQLLEGRQAEFPPELGPYVQEKLGGPAGLQRWLEEHKDVAQEKTPLRPEAGEFAWPTGAPADGSATVLLMCLTDERGAALECEAVQGEEPWRAAALADVKKIRFRPVRWGLRPLKSLRLVEFGYGSGRRIEARLAVLPERVLAVAGVPLRVDSGETRQTTPNR
jgi:tetratricopeptide (TPR) repeat protein